MFLPFLFVKHCRCAEGKPALRKQTPYKMAACEYLLLSRDRLFSKQVYTCIETSLFSSVFRVLSTTILCRSRTEALAIRYSAPARCQKCSYVNSAVEHTVHQSLRPTEAVHPMITRNICLGSKRGPARQDTKRQAPHLDADRLFATNHIQRLIIRSTASVDRSDWPIAHSAAEWTHEHSWQCGLLCVSVTMVACRTKPYASNTQ